MTQDVTQHSWMKNWLSHLVLKDKQIELQIQGVNAEKAFTSQHTKNCRIAGVDREGVKYVLRDVKTFLNLSGPDHKIK